VAEPFEEDLTSARDWIARKEAQRLEQEAERSRPADTRDGVSIAIGANINRPDQAPLRCRRAARAWA
jgi:phosphocarrier protein FPr